MGWEGTWHVKEGIKMCGQRGQRHVVESASAMEAFMVWLWLLHGEVMIRIRKPGVPFLREQLHPWAPACLPLVWFLP